MRASILKKIDKDPKSLKQYKEDFTIDRIMQRIHFIRILDESEQQLLHQMLDNLIRKIPNLKVILLDTFSEHFRSTDIGFNERRKMIHNSLMGLQKRASEFGVSIILINNMKSGKRELFTDPMTSSSSFNQPLP